VACWLEAPTVAVITAEIGLLTTRVVTVKVAVVVPAATVTDAANCTEGSLLLSITAVPPEGAAAESVTVPSEEFPPATEVGLSTKLTTVGEGTTTSVAVCIMAFIVAVIVAVTCIATTDVMAVKVVLLVPAGTVTLAGTVTAGSLLASATVLPPGGAGPESVTVPMDGWPPSTGEALNTTLLTVNPLAGFTVSVAVCVPPSVAVMVAVWVEVTAKVVMLKIPRVEPEGTVTDAGTVTAPGLLLVSGTTVPPCGAKLFMLNCPVEVSPPVVAAGFNVSPLTVVGGVTPRRKVCTAPLSVALKSTPTLVPTAVVFTVKEPWVAPAGMVKSKVPLVALGGMVMLLPVGTGAIVMLPELRVTTVPPVGAGCESSTVPVVIVPPTRTLGEKIRLES